MQLITIDVRELPVMKKQLIAVLLSAAAVLACPFAAIAGSIYEGKALNTVENDMDRARISVDTESGILRINFVKEGDRQADLTLTYDQLVGMTAGEFVRSGSFWERMLTDRTDYEATQFFIDYRTASGEIKTTRVYVDDVDGRRFENEVEELIDRARAERPQQAQPQAQPTQAQQRR
jgi:hypothetical protein